jgi:RHS repeat-associated protein
VDASPADGTVDYYNADVVTANDYYPFGMQMPGRKYSNGGSYRYSINGQEKEKELNENITTAQYWEYDSRIGRRWNADPIVKEWESPYATFGNNPVLMTDPLGLDWYKNKKSGNIDWFDGSGKHKGYGKSLGVNFWSKTNSKGVNVWYGSSKDEEWQDKTLDAVVVTGTRKKDNSLMERMLQVSNVTQADRDAYNASHPRPSEASVWKNVFWDATVGALNPVEDLDVYISANIKHKTELKTFAPVTFGKYQPSTTVVWAGLQGGFTTEDGQGLYGNLVTGDVSYLSLKVDATGTEIRALPFRGLGVTLSANKGAMYGEYSPQLRILQDTKIRFYGIPIQAELGMGRSQAPTIGLRGKLETPTVLGYNAEVVGGVRASLQWPALIRAIFNK